MTTDSAIQCDEILAEKMRRLFAPAVSDHDTANHTGHDFDQWLTGIETEIVPHLMPVDSPRFIGHMTSAIPSFHEKIAGLVTSLNQNLVKRETSGILTDLERNLLNRLSDFVFGNSSLNTNGHGITHGKGTVNARSEKGILTSGGTLANITALWCARNRLANRTKADPKDMVIIGSELMHYSFDKAVDLLGLGPENLIRVPVDENHRVQTTALRQAVRNCLQSGQKILALIGIAGTTDSGATDSLVELAEIAEEYRIHFHVDAAWGGPLLFSSKHRGQLVGIENADSVTLDGHKQLYTPLGIGLLLFKDAQLTSVIEKTAPYAVRESADDLGRRSLEGTRRAMILHLDAALQMIGDDGYGWLIEESIRNAGFLKDEIVRRNEFELLVEPQSNIVLYRHLPPQFASREGSLTAADHAAISDWNIRLQRMQRQHGRTFVSRTKISSTKLYNRQDVVALRAILANPLTTEADISAVLDDQVQIAAEPG